MWQVWTLADGAVQSQPTNEMYSAVQYMMLLSRGNPKGKLLSTASKDLANTKPPKHFTMLVSTNCSRVFVSAWVCLYVCVCGCGCVCAR